ncbi:MAG: hypothetical protein WCR63_03165 [Bacilli bacterium]
MKYQRKFAKDDSFDDYQHVRKPRKNKYRVDRRAARINKREESRYEEEMLYSSFDDDSDF